MFKTEDVKYLALLQVNRVVPSSNDCAQLPNRNLVQQSFFGYRYAQIETMGRNLDYM